MEQVLDRPKSYRKVTGSRLKGKAFVAKALLDSGYTQRSTAEITGISQTSVQALSHQNIVPQSQVEPIVRSLRNRSALLANSALIGITDEKLREASALECAKVFDLAMKNAGLAPPSITESYSYSVSKYLTTNEAVKVSQDATLSTAKIVEGK